MHHFLKPWLNHHLLIFYFYTVKNQKINPRKIYSEG
ncbi:hypothetical protein CHY_0648 [Carboxydothermus hydrogenoformans Z-2901]|uniref:Uncharacterized protein n=1 Tax=Carboxydothermus hydrogenoformans (strain ATCC BAA-161 / DSM 6008 / Z-2901) TaxID=246194 RepID=Q3AED0_CARHZ|nr:hypothetical protein CHY_0648 [Carboxydothermus hydrogenoformans Z-2901]